MRLTTLLFSSLFPLVSSAEFVPLFNGKDLSGWQKIIAKLEIGEDPDGHITVHDGMVHMYQNAPEDGSKVPFGVIMTEREDFSKFHLKFDYKWVGKRFPPRKEKLRDAGLLYHCFGKKIWPPSIECQVQEGDTGDLVFIDSSAVTWRHPFPDLARKGQGQAGRLPEYGGATKLYPKGGYVGRFPENDNNTGWTTVEAIVHENHYGVHLVNGVVTSRVLDMQQPDGTKLTQGPIALQLEAAEIVYKNIEINELNGYLKPSSYQVSFSKVGKLEGASGEVTLKNMGTEPLAVRPRILGKNAPAFEVRTDDFSPLAAGEERAFPVEFGPDSGPGEYVAGIQFGEQDSGTFVQLRGIWSPALEGGNEPPLAQIVRTLGIDAEIGGEQLALGMEADKHGQSLPAGLVKATGSDISITPLARYAPPGEVPFGILVAGERQELGKLADTSASNPEAHQEIFPEVVGKSGAMTVVAPEGEFGFFVKGPHYTAITSELSDGKFTARMYPARTFQGRRLKDAYLLAFEEAKNGDYQDALFLVEGITAGK